MKSFNFNYLEVCALRCALSKRLLELRLSQIKYERCDLPTDSILDEMSVVDSLLSKISNFK